MMKCIFCIILYIHFQKEETNHGSSMCIFCHIFTCFSIKKKLFFEQNLKGLEPFSFFLFLFFTNHVGGVLSNELECILSNNFYDWLFK